MTGPIQMFTSRREFLQGLVAGSTALGVGWNGNRAVTAIEREALGNARRQERRRNVLNQRPSSHSEQLAGLSETTDRRTENVLRVFQTTWI